MIEKKKKPPLTREETLELIEKAMRKPGMGGKTLSKLQTQRSKLLEGQQTPSSSPVVMWKPEDLFTIKPDDTSEKIADKEAANQIIQADGFWTIGPDGNRWGPLMRQQRRYIGPVNGASVGEWEELCKVLDTVKRTRERAAAPQAEEAPNTKPEVSASQCEAEATQADALRKSLNVTELDVVGQPDDGLSFEVRESMEKHRREEQDRADNPKIIL
jgi:hypothetical protein